MDYPFSLENKTVLVTGASSGIGKAISVECSKMGAKLIITARNEERLTATLNELRGEGHKMIIGDLNDEEFRKEIVKTIPKLDGVVLAAGVVEMFPVLFASREKFDKMFDTNFFAPVDLLRLIVKKKAFNSAMSVVTIASIAGTDDFAYANGIYGSTKSALISFMKSFAKETASKGIRVNTISPGMILTPMHSDGTIEEEKLAETVANVPMKRWGKPEEIAYATIYLLSDAAAYLTGSDIKIDGGWTLL